MSQNQGISGSGKKPGSPGFVFLPKLMRRSMRADEDAVLTLFGKNEQVKRALWGIFAAFAGLVLA
jgi:hypothetical protein